MNADAFFALTREEQIARITAELQRLAAGDAAPSRNRWDAQRDRELPICETIDKYYGWSQVVFLAGLRRPFASRGNNRTQAFTKMVAAVGAESDATIARQRAERDRGWPLQGELRSRKVRYVELPNMTVRQTVEVVGLR